jgi:hypothetical protein
MKSVLEPNHQNAQSLKNGFNFPAWREIKAIF